ncbi:hypothetical protein [Antarcticirhabdus aurantiaca]|uniref:Uncharacterized protein n=1 Tax=Antarcticirhabdus aurantiaca TaxID=2606717 RepID=A0ACD4NM37_9HYPH|nr:hypothetical protein [Antarcticirhabdus aurantiaca]WAJ27891.1 hypothetical protein OXU80_24110 [Jeongeuplla avenae]
METASDERPFRYRWRRGEYHRPLFYAYDGDLCIGQMGEKPLTGRDAQWQWSIHVLRLPWGSGGLTGSASGTPRDGARSFEDAFDNLLPKACSTHLKLDAEIALFQRHGLPLPPRVAFRKRVFRDGHPFPAPDDPYETAAEWIDTEHRWMWGRLLDQEKLTTTQMREVWAARWAERMKLRGVEGVAPPPFGCPRPLAEFRDEMARLRAQG